MTATPIPVVPLPVNVVIVTINTTSIVLLPPIPVVMP